MALLIIDHLFPDGKVAATYFATAFFISEKFLLTAGHNLSSSSNVKVKVRITLPGTPYYQQTSIGSPNAVPTIDCRVVNTLYKNADVPSHHDIAILDAGTYNASSYIELSSDLPILPSKVNVIGYPGIASQIWLRSHEGIGDIESNRRTTEEMFPAQRMTISSGPVTAVGKTISYRLSTVHGMSGGCVLYNGYAVGILGRLIECLLHLRSSHRAELGGIEWAENIEAG
jgi:hypothetical protein